MEIAGSQINPGKETDIATVGQLVQEMTQKHYLRSRRNPGTFNKHEVESVLTGLFSNALQLDKSQLNKDAEFIS